MLRTYFLTLVRQVMKHSVVTVIAVGGLTIGFSSCLLIGLYLDYHAGFEHHHGKRQNIYRVIRGARKNAEVMYGERTSGGLASALKADFPEVLEAVRIHRWLRNVQTEEKRIADLRFCMADPEIFGVFDLGMDSAEGMSILGNPSSILLTERLAGTLFGSGSALGKSIRVGNVDYRVEGILRDIPAQSSLQFDMLAAPQPSWNERWQTWNEMRNKPVELFVLLRDGADPEQLEQRFPRLVRRPFRRGCREYSGVSLTAARSYPPLLEQRFRDQNGGARGLAAGPRRGTGPAFAWVAGGLRYGHFLCQLRKPLNSQNWSPRTCDRYQEGLGR